MAALFSGQRRQRLLICVEQNCKHRKHSYINAMRKQGNTSKQINDTWAIRGIEPETRTAATMAARRAGETVGAWCNRALREAATARLKERVPGPTIEETLSKLAESMAQQAAATQSQVEQARQQNVAMLARLEAVEQREGRPGRSEGGNLFARLHGLLWRWSGQPEAIHRQD